MRAPAVSAVLAAACGGSSPEPVVTRDAAADADAAPPRDGCIVWPGDWQSGTARDDRAGVTISPAGDVYVYGYEDGLLGVENVEPAGLPRGYIERVSGRRPGWRWMPRAATGDVIDALHVGSDGTALFSGRVREPAPPDRRAQYQLLVGELDAHGVPVDRRELGEPPSEHPRQLATAGDWNVAAGYHDIYIPTNYVEAVDDPFFVAWRDGELASARMVRFETRHGDRIEGVAIDPDGRVTVGGTSEGPDASGAFVRRYGADGQLVAHHWISKGPLEALAALRRLPDGDFVVAGSTWKPLAYEPTFGAEDVFVARYDATFSTLRWLRKLGTAGSEIAVDIAVADDGRTWLVGETLGTFDGIPNRGAADLFVAALAGDGEVRWVAQRGSPGDDRPERIAVDACENVVVAGATNGELVAGFAPASFDAFAMRVRR